LGVFGGLGGGGGPGLATDGACPRAGNLLFVFAYFPASGSGGGAANLGGGGPLGGDGSRGGVGSLVGSAFVTDRRVGGGAGGAPRPRPAVAFCGLSDLVLEGPVGGGGGGGALFLWFSIPFTGGVTFCAACCFLI
jgi:hypothetical protein